MITVVIYFLLSLLLNFSVSLLLPFLTPSGVKSRMISITIGYSIFVAEIHPVDP